MLGNQISLLKADSAVSGLIGRVISAKHLGRLTPRKALATKLSKIPIGFADAKSNASSTLACAISHGGRKILAGSVWESTYRGKILGNNPRPPVDRRWDRELARFVGPHWLGGKCDVKTIMAWHQPHGQVQIDSFPRIFPWLRRTS